ncbi:MAG: hypothetical protein JWO36_124 [Myxococcales bacterium]|nr:hypothetical protein [Myxococcales bacterium]
MSLSNTPKTWRGTIRTDLGFAGYWDKSDNNPKTNVGGIAGQPGQIWGSPYYGVEGTQPPDNQRGEDADACLAAADRKESECLIGCNAG